MNPNIKNLQMTAEDILQMFTIRKINHGEALSIMASLVKLIGVQNGNTVESFCNFYLKAAMLCPELEQSKAELKADLEKEKLHLALTEEKLKLATVKNMYGQIETQLREANAIIADMIQNFDAADYDRAREFFNRNHMNKEKKT